VHQDLPNVVLLKWLWHIQLYIQLWNPLLSHIRVDLLHMHIAILDACCNFSHKWLHQFVTPVAWVCFCVHKWDSGRSTSTPVTNMILVTCWDCWSLVLDIAPGALLKIVMLWHHRWCSRCNSKHKGSTCDQDHIFVTINTLMWPDTYLCDWCCILVFSSMTGVTHACLEMKMCDSRHKPTGETCSSE
jgi:hypothetical protein